MKNKIFLYLVLLLIGETLLSQTQTDSSNYFNNSNYIDISSGLAIGNLRDMATSPLFYTGVLPTVDFSYSDYFNKNLIKVNLSSLNGIYVRTTVDDFYSSSANIINFELSYYKHYDEYDDGSLMHWPGISLNNYTAIRINNSFGNAAFTLDNISSMNLNYMITKNFTRKAKEKKFLWLIKYKRKQKDYLFSFKTGIPVYSLIYRPGFTNPGNATQTETLLPGYKFTGKVFSGINTNLGIARMLKNGNMIKFSYNWDFFTSGKYSLNRLDYSKHSFLFSLVFKLN
jgi:hypothetical protein